MNPLLDVTLPRVEVLDSTMAFREAGDADRPVALFLHGNPTSSYIWRNVMPLVAPVAHCIAPDLIGFGQSGKPQIDYRFFDHVRYLDAFIDALGISGAFIVAQDWGTALAFHLAARRPDFIRGLAFMEFIRPLPRWDDFRAEARETFQRFRTPGIGEQMILVENMFVEKKCRSTVHRSVRLYHGFLRGVFPTNFRSKASRPTSISRSSRLIARWLVRPIPSRRIPAHKSLRPSPNDLREGLWTAVSCRSVTAPTSCKRIIPRSSVRRFALG